MKKFLILLLCAMLVLAVGCSEKSDSKTVDGSVVFTEKNLPRIAATPLTADTALNYASAILGADKTEAAKAVIVCDTTDECYIKLIKNECDIVVAYPYGSVAESVLSTTALRFTSTEIRQDALVFLTNGKQKVDAVSTEQLKSLFTKETTDWSGVGGEAMAVVLFGQKVGTAVQNAFEKYIGADVKISAVTSTVATDKGDFMAEISYDNRNGGLGYALYSQSKNLLGKGTVPLKVDGFEPTEENIATGKYPLKVPMMISIRASEAAKSDTRLLYDWMLSEQGLKCVTAG